MAPPDPPASAVAVFGAEVGRAVRYAEILSTDGVVRGAIGPREVPRIWERHLLNSAVVGELVPRDSTVVDVGSGAGLPGLPLALARPDLRIVLLEPMQRRCDFLSETIDALGLDDRISVVRGRAPEAATVGGLRCDVVVARAVAPLGPLASMLLPLVRTDGLMLALRGSRAEQEIVDAAAELEKSGARGVGIVMCGVGLLDEPTTVVRATRAVTPRRNGGRASHPARREREAGRDKRTHGQARST